MPYIRALLIALVFTPFTLSQAEEGNTREFESKVRNVWPIEVINQYGDIDVQGWSLDKIRIQVTTTRINGPSAESETERSDFLSEFPPPGLQSLTFDKRYTFKVKLDGKKNKSLKFSEKLKTSWKVDLKIFAPFTLKLKLWSDAYSVSVSKWRNEVDIRSSSGEMKLEQIRYLNNKHFVYCLNCKKITIDQFYGSLQLTTGTSDLSIQNSEFEKLFWDSQGGMLLGESIKGDKLNFITQSGSAKLKDISGFILFKSRTGSLFLDSKIEHGLSAYTDTGDITIHVANPNTPALKLLAESVSGNVQLNLPSQYRSKLTVKGNVSGEKLKEKFPIIFIEPRLATQMEGWLGKPQKFISSTEWILVSEKGSIEILEQSKGPAKIQHQN